MLTRKQLEETAPHALERVAGVTGLGERHEGKVRDMYVLEGKRVIVTTDRVSAFDRVLGTIPYKGQVLNQLSTWWFEQVCDLVGNHIISTPDPAVAIVREAEMLPVEVIVRGYITGVTSTALWTLYSQGVEKPYGLTLPEGLRKNDALPEPVITPTTKGGPTGHDERLTCDEVVENGLVEVDLWEEVKRVAVEIFKRGQAVAAREGLILVDTKYEFGLIDGKLALVDEVHTPDSSRYWIADSYKEAMASGGAPKHFDKEMLRLWFAERGYKGDGEAPSMPASFQAEVAERYITAFEKLTGTTFVPGAQPADERVVSTLNAWAAENN